MKVIPKNCESCPEYIKGECDTLTDKCMCKRCPRNLPECLITRYCRETESVLSYGRNN
ncbi:MULTISPECIES: hypothetical protein [Clostridiaceae]|uniref:hypothetical protein n=1 Tax=Clostridiaceae TaxID=31979 RepID=UPI00055425AC|nr:MULTISPECIES: hypothetical protein [Clostridiaceae]